MSHENINQSNTHRRFSLLQFRVFCILGAVLYPAWHFIFLIATPDINDSLEQRLVVGFVIFCAVASSYFSERIRRFYVPIYLFLAIGITIHFFSLIKASNLSNEYAATALVLLFAIYFTLERIRDFFVYTVAVLAGTIYATSGHTEFSAALFWACIGTTILLSYVIVSIQERANQLLSDRNRFIEKVVETVPEVIYLYSVKDRKFVYFNKQVKMILGRSVENAKSLGPKFLEEIVHPEDLSIVKRAEDELARDTKVDVVRTRYRMLHLDGTYRWIESADVAYERDEDGRLVSILRVARDVSEEVKIASTIESQRIGMIEAAKLASLGVMAGGVAHEINNPLTLISGSAQQLKLLLSKEEFSKDRMIHYANIIENTTFRIARIVKSLKVFARDGSRDDYSTVKVGQIIEDAMNLCQEKFLSRGVKIEVDNHAAETVMKAQAVQLVQVLVNLINNAYDAIEALEVKKIKISTEVKGEIVKISVEDNGGGIPVQIRSKIMDPFFTTKPVGKGTGLGLSISKGIVESHGGVLKLEDTTETTKFTIEIPKAA